MGHCNRRSPIGPSLRLITLRLSVRDCETIETVLHAAGWNNDTFSDDAVEQLNNASLHFTEQTDGQLWQDCLPA